eukprot:GHVU01142782.1.p1 GENE.GHVU01142782.1~~GHVU01142782.1.p1  ORF type:complete len:133 (-),score=0.90 GHVU01142782.1:415-813(-)
MKLPGTSAGSRFCGPVIRTLSSVGAQRSDIDENHVMASWPFSTTTRSLRKSPRTSPTNSILSEIDNSSRLSSQLSDIDENHVMASAPRSSTSRSLGKSPRTSPTNSLSSVIDNSSRLSLSSLSDIDENHLQA